MMKFVKELRNSLSFLKHKRLKIVASIKLHTLAQLYVNKISHQKASGLF